MGYTLLYIAFGIVALWLLGEVLLQYKARLRWRLLAFAGFLGVAAGVAASSVVVILLGAAGFGTGQTLVTLSYRRGETAGWALGGRPSTSRRRRTRGAAADGAGAEQETGVQGTEPPGADIHSADTMQATAVTLPPDEDEEPEVSAFGVPYAADGQPDGGAAEPPVYSPEPLTEDSGEYAVYGRSAAQPQDPYGMGAESGYGGFPPQPGYGTGEHAQPWPEQQPAAASYDQAFTQPFEQPAPQQPAYQGYAGYGGQEYEGPPQYEAQPQYDGQQAYGGGQQYDPAQQYPGYEQQPYPGYEQQQQYQDYQQPDGYGGGQYQETPPGGVWAAQQYPQPPADQAFVPEQAPAQQTWAADPYQTNPY